MLGDVVYACAMGQSELLGRAQGRSPPRLPRVLVRHPCSRLMQPSTNPTDGQKKFCCCCCMWRVTARTLFATRQQGVQVDAENALPGQLQLMLALGIHHYGRAQSSVLKALDLVCWRIC